MIKRSLLIVCIITNCSHAIHQLENRAYILHNTVQEYSWGSKQALAQFLGYPSNTDLPMAELWMGAHPKAPSQILIDGTPHSLLTIIEQNPTDILGDTVAKNYNNQLSFLYKVLAADQPLSLQVHPNKEQAQEGFQKENHLNIPLDASNRNYKDANHKPELFCALTPFWGLNGFKPLKEIVRTLHAIKSPLLHKISKQFLDSPSNQTFRTYFTSLLNLEPQERKAIVSQVVAFAQDHSTEEPIYQWLLVYNNLYPGDISVLVCLLLNLVYLEPSQAMFVGAGQIHAYLKGMGIEIMANSDNVLRAGGTNKHIDSQELLKILCFEEKKDIIIFPRVDSNTEKTYDTPAPDFQLSVLDIHSDSPFLSKKNRGVEIILCTSGQALFIDTLDGATLELTQGISIIVPASLEQYKIEGNAILFKASVP